MEKPHRNRLLNNPGSRNYKKSKKKKNFSSILLKKRINCFQMPITNCYHEDCRQEKVNNKGCLYKLVCSSSPSLMKYT